MPSSSSAILVKTPRNRRNLTEVEELAEPEELAELEELETGLIAAILDMLKHVENCDGPVNTTL